VSSPDQDRIDNLAEMVARLVARQDETVRRLARLEEKLGSSAPDAAAIPTLVEREDARAAPRASMPDRLPALSDPVSPLPSSKISATSPKRPVLETKIGLTILNRIGVLTLILGVAFFFKWAADNDWIGPAGRIVLGVAGGFLALAAAEFAWRKDQRTFSQGITGAGVAILYISLYAAFAFYQLISQPFAFVLMLAVTAMAIALASRYNAQAIALLGLIGGFLTPILLSSEQSHHWFLFAYLLILNLASLWLGRRNRWPALNVLSFIATTLICGDWIFRYGDSWAGRTPATLAIFAYYAIYWYVSEPILLYFLQILATIAVMSLWEDSAVIFFGASLLVAIGGLWLSEKKALPFLRLISFSAFWLGYFLVAVADSTAMLVWARFSGVTVAFLVFVRWQFRTLLRDPENLTPRRLSSLAGNALVYFGISYGLLTHDHHALLGPLAAVLAAIYLIAGIRLHRNSGLGEVNKQAALLVLAIAFVFLTLAIPIQFVGFTVALAWALQAAVITWLALRLNNQRALIGGAFVFLIDVARVLLIESTSFSDVRSHALIANTRFLTFTVVGVALLLSARWSKAIWRGLALSEYIAGHVVLLTGLALEAMDWAFRTTPPQSLVSVQTLSISVLFGIYAVALIGIGVAFRSAINRVAGLVLIGIVILKLYFFDIWQLDRIYRISAFVALGILLIAASFLYSKFRRLVEGWWKDDGVQPE
jgi:uncharacterized membrane protein